MDILPLAALALLFPCAQNASALPAAASDNARNIVQRTAEFSNQAAAIPGDEHAADSASTPFSGRAPENKGVVLAESDGGKKASLTAGNGGKGVKFEEPPISADQEEKDSSADDAKKTANMKRNLLGGAYGAVAFGLLGLFFGGPLGAILGAIGGGLLMAGITNLNNNKIK
jgi:hypothetical protein